MTSSGDVGTRLNVPDRGPLPVHPDVARDGEVTHLNNELSTKLLQLAQSFLRFRMHALNRLGCINLQNICGHHQEEVLRFPKHPQLAKFG